MNPWSNLMWSIRREVWENRSVWIAPLIVVAVVLFGSLIGTLSLPKKMRTLNTLDPARQHAVVVRPFANAPAPIMLASFMVGLVYALDALYGERRDHSILFWKSLPVSDRTTVLSKAVIPLVVLPLIALALSLITIFILFIVSNVWLVVNGMSPARLWTELRFVQQPLIMAYGLGVHALWFAPIYCWLLLVSAWARRAPVLWAVLPFLAIAAIEAAAFNTATFMRWLQYRVMGAMSEAFAFKPQKGTHAIIDQLAQLDPAGFLAAPGLWGGLLFAATCLVAAVHLRRLREPI